MRIKAVNPHQYEPTMLRKVQGKEKVEKDHSQCLGPSLGKHPALSMANVYVTIATLEGAAVQLGEENAKRACTSAAS